MEPIDDETRNASSPVQATHLLQQIQQLQEAISAQQRLLMRTADENVRSVGLRATGLLVRHLLDLETAARQLDQELRAQATEQDRLRALQEVGAAINSSLDVDVVLQQVMDAIIRLTRAERAMLLLNSDGELEVKMARNLDQETLDDVASLDISRSIVRRVAETGEPIVTINAQEDERFASQHSIVSYKLRSILCAPLKIKGETIGVLYADNRVASGIFSDADRDLLAGFADQAAVAIDNARLFQEVTGMKELMDNVFASIASGVVTIDETGRIALYNRAAERILGGAGDAVLGRGYESALLLLGLPIAPLVELVQREEATQTTELDVAPLGRTGLATVRLIVSPLRGLANEQLGGVALLLDDVSEKKRVESLRRYLPPALVDRVRDLDAAQRPQRRTLTVLFADIRDFSRFGEYVDPEELIHLANGFFSEAVSAIAEHYGLIDKFTGDAVMALFNTPLNPQGDHVEQAVRAALRIQTRLAAYQRSLPPDKVLHVGIGIHTGETVVGNVGSETRKDYSAVGDVVNLCKRLQEMAGPDETLVSRDVYRRVQDWIDAVPLLPMQVKGRQTLEEVFRVVGPRQR